MKKFKTEDWGEHVCVVCNKNTEGAVMLIPTLENIVESKNAEDVEEGMPAHVVCILGGAIYSEKDKTILVITKDAIKNFEEEVEK